MFIHINKCGGSSVEDALHIPFAHRTAASFINEMGREWWDNRLSFTVIRNPWDKVVSHYHYRVKTNQTGLRDQPLSFENWVRAAYRDHDPRYYDLPLMFAPQSDWLRDPDGDIAVNFIGKFENLQADFDEVCRRLGKSTGLLPHLKRSAHIDYRRYYTPETKHIIGDYFTSDLEKFNYTF